MPKITIAEQWHYWWLQPDGTWAGQRGQSCEVQIVPQSQLRDHLPSECRCGTALDVMADGALRVTHQLYGPERYGVQASEPSEHCAL